ncbi:MAG: hypothetical protein ACR2K1_14895 [Saprospiraceae bacterium]
MIPDIDSANEHLQALDRLPGNVRQVLIAEGRVFLTKIARYGGITFSGTLIAKANDWNDARRIAYERGMGETVEGCVQEIIPIDKPAKAKYSDN